MQYQHLANFPHSELKDNVNAPVFFCNFQREWEMAPLSIEDILELINGIAIESTERLNVRSQAWDPEFPYLGGKF